MSKSNYFIYLILLSFYAKYIVEFEKFQLYYFSEYIKNWGDPDI